MRDNIPQFNSIPPRGRMFNISRVGQAKYQMSPLEPAKTLTS